MSRIQDPDGARPPAIAPAAPVDLDLAFSAAEDLPPELLQAAGVWFDPLQADEALQGLLLHWLAQLQPELPAALQSGAYSLGLSLVGDAEIAALNRDWRHKDGPTDVLAFAAQDEDLEEPPPLDGAAVARPGDATLVAAVDDTSVDDISDDISMEAMGLDDTGMEAASIDHTIQTGIDAAGPDVARAGADADGPMAAVSGPGDGAAGRQDVCGPLELGDIVISIETAARQAGEHGHDLERELLFLASHGLLHLLGWDHPDEDSLAAMLARQEGLLQAAPAKLPPLA